MSLFRTIVLAALLAGLATGVVSAAVELLTTVPLILQAETYEHAAPGPQRALLPRPHQAIHRPLSKPMLRKKRAISRR